MSLRLRDHHAFGAPDWSQRRQRFQPLTSVDRTPVVISFAPRSGQERGSAGQCRGPSIPENPGSAGVGPKPCVGISCRRDRATVPVTEVYA